MIIGKGDGAAARGEPRTHASAPVPDRASGTSKGRAQTLAENTLVGSDANAEAHIEGSVFSLATEDENSERSYLKSLSRPERRLIAREIVNYWKDHCPGRRDAAMSEGRVWKVMERLYEGRTPLEFREAIDGACRAAYVDDHGVRHDDIATIAKNPEKFERFLARGRATKPGGGNPSGGYANVRARRAEALRRTIRGAA